jgi:DNA-binding transcriptional LysR family regulator
MNLRRLDLNLLTVFDAVIAERSVSRAAARLSLTQPAVSHALGRLREACGDAIIERYGRGMVPTPRALALHGEVRAILARAQRVFAMSGAFDPSTSERVFHLGASDYAAQIALPRLVGRLRKSAPQVRIAVHHTGRNDGPDLVRSGVLDAALGVFSPAEDEIQTELVAEEPYACAMSARHPLARKRRLSLEDYANAAHVQVLVQPGITGVIEETLGRLGRPRRVAVVSAHFLVAASLLGESDLLLTAPRGLFAAARTHGLKLHALPFAVIPFRTQLACARRQLADPGLTWLRGQFLPEANSRPKARSRSGKA